MQFQGSILIFIKFSIFQRILLTWGDEFDIESDFYTPECLYDYVEIRQRYLSSTGGELVGRYCGGNTPDPLLLVGPIHIKYHVDWFNGGSGWNIRWVSECK